MLIWKEAKVSKQGLCSAAWDRLPVTWASEEEEPLMSQLTVLLVYSTRTSRFKNKPGPEGQNSNIFYCQAQVVSTSTNEENLESHGLPVARPRHAINKRLRISKRCFGNRSPAANRSARPLQIP